MSNEEKIEKLLATHRSLVDRLNQLNDRMNEVGTDQEDMIPGHDDGQEWWDTMNRYKVTLHQLEIAKKELRELGYQKAL